VTGRAAPALLAAFAAGDNHTCAISGDEARCWGDDSRGQLGDGTVTFP